MRHGPRNDADVFEQAINLLATMCIEEYRGMKEELDKIEKEGVGRSSEQLEYICKIMERVLIVRSANTAKLIRNIGAIKK